MNWASNAENGQLKSVTYNKTRNDTILRVEFHSSLGQYTNSECSTWYIQFDGVKCSQPAPIQTGVYRYGYGGWNIAPAEVSGFCRSTSRGELLKGNIQISVHVKQGCSSGGNAHTGRASAYDDTSYLLVEEYCK